MSCASDLLFQGAAADHAAHQARALGQEQAEVQLGLHAAQETDGDDRAQRRQGAQVLVQVGRADGVEDDVRAVRGVVAQRAGEGAIFDADARHRA